MAEEFFDVVNERDEPVGRATRREVHARGLWHRAVYVLVFNQAGRVFIQKRSMRKDMSPGLWDASCSGHVDAGEDYASAVVRELREELGLHVAQPPARILRVEACELTGWEFVWVHRLDADGPFTLHPEEIDGGEWLEPAELSRRMATRPEEFCAPFRMIWAKVAG
jgi:isopentenyldiphosphate isomerase